MRLPPKGVSAHNSCHSIQLFPQGAIGMNFKSPLNCFFYTKRLSLTCTLLTLFCSSHPDHHTTGEGLHNSQHILIDYKRTQLPPTAHSRQYPLLSKLASKLPQQASKPEHHPVVSEIPSHDIVRVNLCQIPKTGDILLRHQSKSLTSDNITSREPIEFHLRKFLFY